MGQSEDEDDLARMAALYQAGLDADEADDRPAAIAAYRALLALDPADRGGVSLRLAALGAAPIPKRMPPMFVSMLFDESAEAFDTHLVDELAYSVPALAGERLAGRGPFERLLDLGCGTGLMAAHLAAITRFRIGLDLAPGMLERAAARGLYDKLYLVDAAGFMSQWVEAGEAPFDLVTAGDLLPYLGDLEPLFAGIGACLAPGGLFAFSTEIAPEGTPLGYVVGRHTRYAHSESYVRDRVARAGLILEGLEEVTIRRQKDAPVAGHFGLARRVP